MRIAVVGGGPGGLYFSALVQQLAQRTGQSHDVTVWERNAHDDTFGFGVVFSDETLGGIEHADPVVFSRMQQEFAVWDDIDVHFKGEVVTSGGHGFAAMSRRRLLEILQDRCRELGVTLHFRTEAPDVDELARTHDLVVACDGLGSGVRARYADTFRPTLEARDCKYIWLGTDKVFDAFKFYVAQTPHGVMQIHGYPYDATGSTFIVEMTSAVWEKAGFGEYADRPWAPGESDQKSIDRIRELFADVLEGHEVMANNSRWISFTTVRNEHWVSDNIVILGDAAHTAHFSIGSGTKLAMEDALALAACLHEEDTLPAALATYETERKAVVLSTQRAAQASLEWFENLGQYVHQDPIQFGFNIMTRSRRVTYDNLRLRDPEFVARCDEWYAAHVAGSFLALLDHRKHPADVPAGPDRVARPGEPGRRVTDGHVRRRRRADLRLPPRAPGRQGPRRRGTGDDRDGLRVARGPDHPWLCRPVGRRAAGVVAAGDRLRAHQQPREDRPPARSLRRQGLNQADVGGHRRAAGRGQLGGRRSSPVPYREGVNQVPRELTRAEMDTIRDQFVESARRGAEAGFDLLELHCAHGYLLSAFLSPVTNRRTDEYGGDVAGRLRYPLEVFAAMREVWPAERPMTVRISATDWVEDGQTLDDALEVARAFVDAGAGAIDVSTGQVTARERPAFGRSYQTPYADAIRNRLGVPTIAVGVISSFDDVNSILLAGRADLCAIGRAHLYDPMWTLHAAIEQDYDGPGAVWPLPWQAGRRKPQAGRTDGPKPRLDLIREGEQGTRHRRWRP